MGWRAVVHSAIGTRHHHKNLPCQDYGKFLRFGSVLVGAVADGAGSARHADLGAKLAVETALAQFCLNPKSTSSDVNPLPVSPLPTVQAEEILAHQQLSGGDLSSFFENQSRPDWEPSAAVVSPTRVKSPDEFQDHHSPEIDLSAFQATVPPSDAEARALFTILVTAVIDALKDLAVAEQWPLKDLACTLLVFVATPDWLMALQIGDGFIVVDDPVEGCQLLFPPSKGEYINETNFVTSADVLAQMQVRVHPFTPNLIYAATDGLEKVALRLQDWSPFPPFFKPFGDCLRVAPDQAHGYLQSFLDSDRLNARTDDDKTLLIGFYDPEAL